MREEIMACSHTCTHSDHDHSHEESPVHNHREDSFGMHHHVDIEDASGSRLLITLVLNFIIPTAQVIGGLYAHSVALMSDATHNFSDFTSVLIAYFAHRIGRRGATVHNTFGYRRVEILAAALNVLILIGAAGFIVYEAVGRFHHPEAVSGKLVMWIAGIGVIGNGLSAWMLHKDAHHSLNIRGAFLHMVGDLLTSVVVLVSGAVLVFKPWYWLDPLLSILIVLFILRNCWSILKEAVAILMNATPKGLNMGKIQALLEQFPGVCGAHYLHAWNVSSSSIAFSCHVVVEDQLLSQTESLCRNLSRALYDHYGIDHPIFQFETNSCGNGSLLCEKSCSGLRALKEEGPEVLSHPEESQSHRSRNRMILSAMRVLFGGIFVYASIDKILHPAVFAQAVYNYQILPDAFINLTALVLPWLELISGLFIIFGVWLPGSFFVTNLLMVTFFGALVFNIARGLNIHCGCFSTSTEDLTDVSMTWYLIRDAMFLLLGGYLFWDILRKGRPGNPKNPGLTGKDLFSTQL